MNIVYSTDRADIAGLEISGFFSGWPNKPSAEVLRESVGNADYVVLAIDQTKRRLAGYITAVSDGVLAAYIPFLEVEETYQKKGVGHVLVSEMLKQLNHLYMVDVVCDKELAGFYEEAGFKSWHAMIKRNYANQSGARSADRTNSGES